MARDFEMLTVGRMASMLFEDLFLHEGFQLFRAVDLTMVCMYVQSLQSI